MPFDSDAIARELAAVLDPADASPSNQGTADAESRGCDRKPWRAVVNRDPYSGLIVTVDLIPVELDLWRA